MLTHLMPQYYGYKYVIDYSKQSVDWLRSPQLVKPDGTTADYNQNTPCGLGHHHGDYSHIRWENAPLGVNGEGRYPHWSADQTVSTVIDRGRRTVVWNNVAKTAAGYNAIELAPLNPHTTSLKSKCVITTAIRGNRVWQQRRYLRSTPERRDMPT